MDIELRIRDGKGRPLPTEAPDTMPVSEFLQSFIPRIGYTLVDEKGNPIHWVLVDGGGRTLDPDKSFRDNGIHSRHELLLEVLETHRRVEPVPPPIQPPTPPVPPERQWICPNCGSENSDHLSFCHKCSTHRFKEIDVNVQGPEGRLLTKQVSPDTTAQQLLQGVLSEWGLSSRGTWEIEDKDISKTLTLQETLRGNRVLNGHHLLVREVQKKQEEDPRRKKEENGAIVLPWKTIAIVIGIVVLLALCGYGIYSVYQSPEHKNQQPPTVKLSPSGSLNLQEGKSQQFSAQITPDSATGVTWSIDPPGLGTISENGLYTAPASIPTSQTVKVIATSKADPGIKATVEIQLSAHVPPTPQAVHVQHPDTLQLRQGQTHQFTADATVTWSLDPPTVGSITPEGLYTAPATVAHQETVTVIATSATDSAVSDRFSFNVLPPPTPPSRLAVTPTTATLHSDQTQQFIASGLLPHAVAQWMLSPQVGHISPQGLYTAPEFIKQQQTITVTARSSAPAQRAPASAVITLVSTVCSGHMYRVNGNAVVDLHPSQTYEFRVAGVNDQSAVEWRVSQGPGEVHRGLYRAPASITEPQRASVSARCGNTQDIEMFVNLLP